MQQEAQEDQRPQYMKGTTLNDINDRTAYQTTSILAKGHTLYNDTWSTNLNNNLLVIGPSGSGKTRDVLKPNLLQCNGSAVVMDTKGTLFHEVGPIMAEHGYKVLNLDFTDLAGSVGYNPLDYIRYSRERHAFRQQDILSVASALCPDEDPRQPFWNHAASDYIASLVAYVMEALPAKDRTLASVVRLFEGLGDGSTPALFEKLDEQSPSSYAASLFRRAMSAAGSPQTHASIMGIVAEKLTPLAFDEACDMYTRKDRVDFPLMGREKTVLFVTVSDMDHSLAKLTNLFVMQAFQTLVASADKDYASRRLPVPVRFYLDDFSNLRVEDFAQTLSVIRSREIYASLFCQTVTQLHATYGEAEALTIVGNCDTQLVLGFQDEATANAYSLRANKPASVLMETPLGKAWLFVRGSKPEVVERFDVTKHPNYRKVEAQELEASDDWEYGFELDMDGLE
jgi:type IV secretion system protein VirD4